MPRYAPENALIALERAKRDDVKAFKRGVYLEVLSGRTIDELCERIVVDRLRLASELRRRGKKLMITQPPQYRDAISRLYYSMYHSMRAVVTYASKGDDDLHHSKLPSRVPGDFPNREVRVNQLKDARERRNDADYSVYPKSEPAWKSRADDLLRDATSFHADCRGYLAGKGCGGL